MEGAKKVLWGMGIIFFLIFIAFSKVYKDQVVAKCNNAGGVYVDNTCLDTRKINYVE